MEEINLLDNPSSKIDGPKFSKKRDSGIGNWLKKNGANIIVPLIAICILIGGIYLYKKWPSEQKSQLSELSHLELEQDNQESSSELSEQSPTPDELQQQQISQPAVVSEKETISVRAEKGQGITHLGRIALSQYLKDYSETATTLTKEHKIYIEDYLKDKKLSEREGNDLVQIDETILFEKDLIKQAIDKSLELNAEQLKRLESYSVLVPSL